jgi:hypothetical protein
MQLAASPTTKCLRSYGKGVSVESLFLQGRFMNFFPLKINPPPTPKHLHLLGTCLVQWALLAILNAAGSKPNNNMLAQLWKRREC